MKKDMPAHDGEHVSVEKLRRTLEASRKLREKLVRNGYRPDRPSVRRDGLLVTIGPSFPADPPRS
jgi:hypothetical protein